MGFALYPDTSPVSRYVRFDGLMLVESRSPLPAFKNLGRGVF
jgi:hypothetical protein